jgi:ribosomal-protein-alanine N-acetyltransferase
MAGRSGTLPRIETARLILRDWAMEDVPALHEICNDQHVSRMTDDIPFPYPLEQARQFVADVIARNAAGTHCVFAVCLKEGGRLLGEMGLWAIEPTHKRADIGMVLHRDCRGPGYATEALSAVVDYGFRALGLHRIEGGCFPENEASARVMEKCGLRREGMLKERWFRDGEWQDDLVLGIVRRDWEAQKAASGGGGGGGEQVSRRT